MKYEMIFGDERLADKFNNEDSVFIVCRGHGVYFEFESGNAGVNYVANCCSIGDSFYMRRIIKEPKRWTWEDKKAGRLPEVGCNVSSAAYGYVCSVVAIDSNSRYVWCQFPDQSVDSCMIFEINPIETPAEKEQREEDEFVTSLCKELDGTSLQHDSIYERGVRAAYRKLKGGE